MLPRFLGLRRLSTQSKHVVVGMSGGVDSAVSAMLLLGQGYRVSGLYCQSWDSRDETGFCQSEEDWADVQRVCQQLNISCIRQSFVSQYWVDVFQPMLARYAAGVTPNPDVDCNRLLKFSELRDFAFRQMGADLFATGHYAQLDHDGDGVPRLLCSPCPKDQTFFLCQVPGEKFRNVLFPVGHLTKEEVREMARRAGLFNSDKKSSAGICFVGKRRFDHFLGEYVPLTAGNYVEASTGRVLGRHDGVEVLTIGQRARIGGSAKRMYVVGKSGSDVLVGEERVRCGVIRGREVRWISGKTPVNVERVTCRYRHTPEMIGASMKVMGDWVELQLDEEHAGIAPGQVVAIYHGNECLGGATIC